MTFLPKLREALAFDHKRIRGDHDVDNHSAFSGAKQENARLAPLLEALLRVVEAAENVLQTKSAGGPIAHADWISLEQSLADIARALDEGGVSGLVSR